MQKLAAVSIAVAVAVSLTAAASAARTTLDPLALTQARKIKDGITTRYTRPGGPKLAVTEASSTGVIESYLLLTSGPDGLRVVPTDNGVYYAICPTGVVCPYPARRARPAADFVPRRQALELAVRTFLETTASVVAVSLPTREYRFFVVERAELAREVDLAALARRLSGDPARAPASTLRRVVDDVTRPRIYVSLGLEPSPSGRASIGAAPLWPDWTPTTRR